MAPYKEFIASYPKLQQHAGERCKLILGTSVFLFHAAMKLWARMGISAMCACAFTCVQTSAP